MIVVLPFSHGIKMKDNWRFLRQEYRLVSQILLLGREIATKRKKKK
jgi:hypothetical protein